MDGKQRVAAALNHIQPDRVPIDCGGHRSSNFSVTAYRNLREYLGLKKSNLYVYDVIQQLVVPEQDIIDLFDIDVLDYGRAMINDESYWQDWELPDSTPIKIPAFIDIRKKGGDTLLFNRKGEPIAIQKEGCLYFEQTRFSYENYESEDFSNLEDALTGNMWSEFGAPPTPLGFAGKDKQRRLELLNEIPEYGKKSIYALYGGSIYETGQCLFRMDNFLADIIGEPKMIQSFLDKLVELYIKSIDDFMKVYAGKIDVMGFGDDLGMQKGPQISPQMYREFFKPCHKAIWSYAKKLDPNIKLCMHCCGGVYPLLEDIIDAGMDAINPVQISCAGMDPKTLKADFGKDITFWGGGCDTQTILPTGSAQEVYDHVSRNLDIMFKDGGFVFQQVHNILGNVPPQNIVAMFKAVRDYA